jgi:hypothetical protein
MIRKILVAATLATSLGILATPASAVVYVRVAPPELRAETVPEPRRNHTWRAGHWEWRGNRHHWVRGAWVRDRPGYRYNQPQWVESNGRWSMQRGSWARGDRDGDGVPNRVDRDRDGDGVRNSQDSAPNNPNRR